MHLNRDQAMAFAAVRDAGYNPVQAIVLTGRHRELQLGVVSVSAISGGERFNIRVGVDSRRNHSEVLSVYRLTTTIDNRKSTNVNSIDGCSVRTINRTYVN